MRLGTLLLTGWLGTVGSSLAYSAPITSSVFCQALLEAGKIKDDLNPLTSLRDVRYRMAKQPAAQNAPSALPYYGFSLKVDLENFRWRPFEKDRIAPVLARLAQLENDASQINFDGTYVGFEFRGDESVRRARAAIVAEINKYEPQVQAELKRRYPYLRMANLIQHGISTFLIGAMAALLSDPQYPVVVVMAAPIMGMALASNELILPYLRKEAASLNFNAQLKTIDEVLAHPGEGAPLHIISGGLEIRTELHKILMTNRSRDLNEDEVQFLTDAAEKIHEKFGDEQWISRLNGYQPVRKNLWARPERTVKVYCN